MIKFYSFLFFLLVLNSCSKDDTAEITDVKKDIKEEVNPTPCSFDLENLSPNTQTIIDCTIDLEGATIILPTGSELVSDLGQITNGTLIFEANGKIDGDLLNLNLVIEGEVRLRNTTFDFVKERWAIEEGLIDNEKAIANKENFQKAIDLSKNLGADTFRIGAMDAFFKTDVANRSYQVQDEEAIHLPSDFNLEMTDATFLRVQPFDLPWGILVSVFKKKNVTITGGNLIGDRYEHTYTPYTEAGGTSRDTHEFPALISVNGAENVVIDGIKLKASTGDCLFIGATGLRTDPNTLFWNKNIVFKNSVADAGRRNNISITDGENITIENNEILNCGLGADILDSNGAIIYSSAGVFPKYGIDVEPYFEYSSFTFESRLRYEWVENVMIKNNRFINNQNGSIIVYTGNNITVDANESDHAIAQNDTQGSKIINNTIIAREDIEGYRAGIETSDSRFYTDVEGGKREQYGINNNVSGNTIKGFSRGLLVSGKDAVVRNNVVSDFDFGLVLKGAENIDVFENVYESTRDYSTGISFREYNNTIKIQKETINVTGHYLFVDGLNSPTTSTTNDVCSYTVEISDCKLIGKITSFIKNTSGLHLLDNTMQGGLQIIKSTGIRFEKNKVVANFVDGVILDESTNSTVIDNTFTLSPNKIPVSVINDTANSNNTVSGNN